MELLKQREKLNDLIKKSDNVFIMGHKSLDLDALASSIGIYEYLKAKKKDPVIIINDTTFEKAVKKALEKVKGQYTIKKSKEIKNDIKENSLLVIVDSNKNYLLQDPELLNIFNNIAVIDHHDISENSMTKGLIIIDRDASSTCEMLTDLLVKESVHIKPIIATLLLSGIVLDTNNYVVKTVGNTYKTSYILTAWGAKPIDVQYLLKQDIDEYAARQKVISDVEKIKNIAITKGQSKIKYRREDLAKIADTLLQFDDIEASFVIGVLTNESIGISARSLGNINVGQILEHFNGGGDEHEAGASIENATIKGIEEELKNIIEALK